VGFLAYAGSEPSPQVSFPRIQSREASLQFFPLVLDRTVSIGWPLVGAMIVGITEVCKDK
jgi:hypothetical protein